MEEDQQQQRMPLFAHQHHLHTPRNVNTTHTDEQGQHLNARIALRLTRSVGTMTTAYSFVVLALIGLLAILGVLPPLIALLVAWFSQTLIQLVLLPIIMVGQAVLSRKQELQADEQFATTRKSYHDISEIVAHLTKQDEVLLQIIETTEKHYAQQRQVEGVQLMAFKKDNPFMKMLEEKKGKDLDGDKEKGESPKHQAKVLGKKTPPAAPAAPFAKKSGASKMCPTCTKGGKSSCSHL